MIWHHSDQSFLLSFCYYIREGCPYLEGEVEGDMCSPNDVMEIDNPMTMTDTAPYTIQCVANEEIVAPNGLDHGMPSQGRLTQGSNNQD